MSILLVVPGNVAPLCYAPSLLLPDNGSYEDLTGTPEFSWTYNAGNPSSGTTQTGYSFTRITNGGVQQWWNASTNSWQSTIIWNTSAVQDIIFPSGAWADGNVYQWAVATADANGEGPFSGYFTVTAQALPTVTVPNLGTITTADPLISWSVTFPTGASQTTYEVIIYNAAQYLAAGFVPGVGPSVLDTGAIGSNSVSSLDLSKVPFYLPNSTSYRAYVQIGETGGQLSNWAYGSFATQYSAPKPPTITATAVAVSGELPYNDLDVQCHDNLLSVVDAVPENGSGLGTWAALANTTLGSGLAPDGFFALSLTAVAAGNVAAETATGTAGYPVLPSTEYTLVLEMIAATTARNFQVVADWYTSAGVFISTSAGAVFTDQLGAMTQGYVTATSPANAAFVDIHPIVDSLAISEVHWFREAGIFIGADTTWGPGGFYGLQEIILLRSDGLYVRGASVANPAAVPAATQYVEIKDPEAYQQTAYTYSAQVIVTYGPNQSVLSTIATSGSVTLIVIDVGGAGNGPWWEFDPLDPFNTACNGQFTNWNPLQVEQSAAHMVTGMPTMNVVSDTVLNKDVNCTCTTFTDADYQDLLTLSTSGTTIFISSPWGPNESGFFRIGPQSGGLSMGTGNRTKDVTLHPSLFGAGYRDTALTAVAQNRPPV